MRARGEVSVAVQGVQRLSPREVAPFVRGVRRGGNLRAWPSALYVQGVRRVEKIEWRAEKVNFNRKSNSATAALIVGI